MAMALKWNSMQVTGEVGAGMIIFVFSGVQKNLSAAVLSVLNSFAAAKAAE